mgnify:FL=1
MQKMCTHGKGGNGQHNGRSGTQRLPDRHARQQLFVVFGNFGVDFG